MRKLGLIGVGTCLAALFSLAQCAVPKSEPQQGGTGGGTTGTGGATGPGGSTGSGGTTGAGGTKGAGGTISTGGTTGAGGAKGAGGSMGMGGTFSTGGATGTAGRTGAGGTTGVGGTMGTGGASVIVDAAGVPLAKTGDQTSTSKQYLNLGDMRLINNRWGSDALNCTGTMQSVYVNADRTIGWTFNRPTCGGMKADPDFPEVEFGVAPFGTGSSLLTTPPFSSTTLLPIQLKNLTTATLTIDTFSTTFQNPTYWDSNFEFWISKEDPTTNANAGVYAEVIMFLGWESNRLSSPAGWPCDKSGTVTAGSTSYNLCHQSDTWSNGQWRFFNFNVANGPMSTFSGKADIVALIDWVAKNYTGFTSDMWLTRIEVGTEIDDNTSGSAKINNLTFEINGTSKSIQLAN